MDTYIPLNSEEKGKFKQELSRLSKKEQEGVMEFETSWQKEGYEMGLQQGIQQGVQQGLEQGLQQGVQQGLQQGIQQGVQQGLQQGIQQGLELGRVELILSLLSHRLGELDKDSVERVSRLKAPELDALGRALLDFSDMADLLSWLQAKEP